MLKSLFSKSSRSNGIFSNEFRLRPANLLNAHGAYLDIYTVYRILKHVLNSYIEACMDDNFSWHGWLEETIVLISALFCLRRQPVVSSWVTTKFSKTVKNRREKRKGMEAMIVTILQLFHFLQGMLDMYSIAKNVWLKKVRHFSWLLEPKRLKGERFEI